MPYGYSQYSVQQPFPAPNHTVKFMCFMIPSGPQGSSRKPKIIHELRIDCRFVKPFFLGEGFMNHHISYYNYIDNII